MKLYIWAGPNVTAMQRYKRHSTGDDFMSFRIIAAVHGGAEADPHFKFHSVVSTNSQWYDPSYGVIRSGLDFDESAFCTASCNPAQQVSPSRWSTETLSGFECLH